MIVRKAHVCASAEVPPPRFCRLPLSFRINLDADEAGRQFDYLIDSKYAFLREFRNHGWNEFEVNREGSWNSMLGIFLHRVGVEDSWVHYALRGKSLIGPKPPELGDYRSFEQVEKYSRRVDAQTDSLLSAMEDRDISREVEFEGPEGLTGWAAGTILMHAIIYETAHPRELICLFWQLNIKLPYISWISYGR